MAPWEVRRGEIVAACKAAGFAVAVSAHGSAVALRDGGRWVPVYLRFDLTADESGWKWCRMSCEVLANGEPVVPQGDWVEQS